MQVLKDPDSQGMYGTMGKSWRAVDLQTFYIEGPCPYRYRPGYQSKSRSQSTRTAMTSLSIHSTSWAMALQRYQLRIGTIPSPLLPYNTIHTDTPPTRAILDMKVQRDKLQQYQKRIAILTARETQVAKECLRRGEKTKALSALRRKKYQESLLTKTDAQLAQLEILTSDVEFALVQKDVLYGLQQGTKVLKEIHKEMGGIDNVERLLGESEEARAYQKEVSDLLAGRMTNQDEDEVEDELEALAREVNGVKDLPNAPTQELPSQEKETPKERRERRAKEREEEERQFAEPMLA